MRSTQRTLALIGLAGLVLLAACTPGGAPPPAASGTIYTGPGFDTCAAPSTLAMSGWLSSPYRSLGIYLGGANRACGDGNLSSSWVSTVETQGWKLVPLYVGLQAPCVFQSGLATISAGTAAAQGSAAADDAVTRAAQFGIGSGSPIYFDMEAYDTTQSSCVNTVLSFVSAWSRELHARGYLAGFYSSAASGIANEAQAAGDPSYTVVDDIWIADWDNKCATVFGYSQYVADSQWWNHQRLHQCQGGHDETYSGITINIDRDYDDGAVAGQ